jgi:tetratricopeptide (TPR) repeat protein
MQRAFRTVFLALALPVACHAADAPMDLTQIADRIDDGRGDEVEATLTTLRDKDPRNPEVLTQLARIEYLRALGNGPQYDGYTPMNWDRSHLDAAERLARQALDIDAKHANAWVVYGQIAYARSDLDESLRRLERAEALDPSSVKLRLRKGATLRALSTYNNDASFLPRAAREYERAIHGKVDDGNERLAASQLAEVLTAMGEYDRALTMVARALETAQGSERSFLLDRKSRTDLLAGHTDAAIDDARAAIEIADHGIARERLAAALLVKAGVLLRDGDAAGAHAAVAIAQDTGVDPRGLAAILGMYPGTFPAVYAYLDPGLKRFESDHLAPIALGQASAFVSSSDLKRLGALGIDLNYVDPEWGTLLHRTIDANNVDAVATLLQLGVDTDIRHPDGRSLLETTLVGTSRDRRRIRQLVLAKVGKPAGWKEPNVDLPVAGHWYRAERALGDPSGAVLQPGQTVLSGGTCHTLGKSDLCMFFYKRPKEGFGTVNVPLSHIDDLSALHEVAAPPEALAAICTDVDCPRRPAISTQVNVNGEGDTHEAAIAEARRSVEEMCKSLTGTLIADTFVVTSEETLKNGHRFVRANMQCGYPPQPD